MKKVLLMAIPALLLVACGGGSTEKKSETGTEQSTAKSFEFTVNGVGNAMADMMFDTKELKVSAGAKVKINLSNAASDASMLHNIVIVKQGSEKEVAMEGINLKDKNYFNPDNANVIAGSGVAGPGQTVSVEFTAPEAGNYSFICTYPGHWTKMQGTLIVE